MTRAADAELMAKVRRGEIITPEDHIGTIDDADELESFRRKLIEAGRMTADIQTAIYRRQIKIGASAHG